MGCPSEPAPVFFFFLSVTFRTNYFIHFRCLAHVVNLANVAVMGHITKIAVIENTNAIWEYDPELPGNRVLGGSLDVVAALRTLVIKVLVYSSIITQMYDMYLCFSDRFRPPDSALSTSKNCSLNARSIPLSRFHYTTIHGGAQHIRCWTVHMSYDR
jgi:hypothetical protein